MLKIKGVGIAKLTQVLFLINPTAFLPFDKASILPLGIGEFRKPPPKNKLSWAEYFKETGTGFGPPSPAASATRSTSSATCGTVRRIRCLTRAAAGTRSTRVPTPGETKSGSDFRDNHWVHHDAAKGMDKPERGDVVLVHSGNGRGPRNRRRLSERLRQGSTRRPDPPAVGEQEPGAAGRRHADGALLGGRPRRASSLRKLTRLLQDVQSAARSSNTTASAHAPSQPDPLRSTRHRQDVEHDRARDGHRQAHRPGRRYRRAPHGVPQPPLRSRVRHRLGIDAR